MYALFVFSIGLHGNDYNKTYKEIYNRIFQTVTSKIIFYKTN